MNGFLIVRPNATMTAAELVNCQKSIARMLKDGIVVVQPGFEVSYINTDDSDEGTKVEFK